MPRPRLHYRAGIAAAALVLALSVAGILQVARTYREDSRWVTHTLQVMSEMDHAHVDLLRGIGAQRTYLLSGDPAFREMFAQARGRVRSDLARLSVWVQDDPVQARRVEALVALSQQRLDLAQESLRLYETEGLAAAQAWIRRNHGSAVAAEIDALVDEFHASERDLLRARAERAAGNARLLVATGLLAIPLGLGILLVLFVLLARESRQRAAAERHAQGLNEELRTSVAALERTSADLVLLGRYTGLLQSCRSTEEAIEVTRRTLDDLLPGVAGTLYLQRASHDALEDRGGWGTHAVASPPTVPPQDCFAIRRVRPQVVEDTVNDLRCPHTRPLPGTAGRTACLPLTAQSLTIGFLYLSAPGTGPLPNLAIAQAAAEQLSLALANLQLQETLRQQSIRDALTGLYNRRYLEASLPRELARCERRDASLAVIMFDLDRFKAFNDAHGHDAGDSLLAAFGQLLLDHARPEDIPCRYGGEEFTLILGETGEDAALARAEAIRRAVAALQVRHLDRPLPGVTLSGGVAMFPTHATAAGALLKAADQALYEAKRGGRDRIVMGTPAIAPGG